MDSFNLVQINWIIKNIKSDSLDLVQIIYKLQIIKIRPIHDSCLSKLEHL